MRPATCLVSSVLLPLLLALSSCGGGTPSCSCDNSSDESTCIELSGLPLYALQMASTCSAMQTGCTAPAVYADSGCPQSDVVADCVVDYASYAETQYWYSTGGEPWASGDTSLEDDCPGTLTWH